jgi:hypothetical protein
MRPHGEDKGERSIVGAKLDICHFSVAAGTQAEDSAYSPKPVYAGIYSPAARNHL